MIINFDFDFIDDVSIEVEELTEEEEEHFLAVVLGVCNSIFDKVEDPDK